MSMLCSAPADFACVQSVRCIFCACEYEVSLANLTCDCMEDLDSLYPVFGKMRKGNDESGLRCFKKKKKEKKKE